MMLPTAFNDELTVVALFNVVDPETFKVDTHVDAPDTYTLVKLVLLNNDVDVAFKLSIFNFEKVEILFKLLNNVVDVAFKLSIFNFEKVEILFRLLKMVVDVAFKLSIFNFESVDKLLKFVLYAYILIPNGVDVIDVIVPWTELSELKITVAIL